MIIIVVTLDAAVSHLVQNDILKESCDDASKPGCNDDQVRFQEKTRPNLCSCLAYEANIQRDMDEARSVLPR